MKKILFILTVLFALAYNDASAQTSLETHLRNFPIADYLNKPIDTLIAHLPVGYDTNYIIGPTGNINRGASLQINYPPNNQFWVYINITDAQYITLQRDARYTRPEDAWPLALLRKEKVGSVTIYTGAYEIINEADIY